MPKSLKSVLYVLTVSCIFIATLCSCTSNYDDEMGLEPNPESLALISNDIWISDAQKWTDSDLTNQTDYTLFSSLPGTEQEIEMHFDRDRNLFLIKTLNNKAFTDDLYCEDGRIVFSKHINLSSGEEWLVAYANEKPYAAALKNGDHWTGTRVDKLGLDFNQIRNGLRKALSYQRKELAKRYHYRILEPQDLITGKFESEISLSFSINVRKGEELSIALKDEPRGIYFTIEPNNGSNMEHIEWKGKVDTTGDMTITVFTVDSNPDQQFTLRTKISNRQNQGYAQVN